MSWLGKLPQIQWKDAAEIENAITKKIPDLVALDQAFQNARRVADPENVRVEGELAIPRAIAAILSDYMTLFQQFTQRVVSKNRLSVLVLGRIDEADVSVKKRTGGEFPLDD